MNHSSSVELVLVGASLAFLVGSFMSMVLFLPGLVAHAVGLSDGRSGRYVRVGVLIIVFPVCAVALDLLKMQVMTLWPIFEQRSALLFPALGSFGVLVFNHRFLELSGVLKRTKTGD